MSLKIKVLSLGLSLLSWSVAEAQYARIDHSRPVLMDRRADLYSTDISWSVGHRVEGVITVEVVGAQNPNEQREKLFACGAQGIQRADWIRANDQYVFRLYEARCPRSTFPGPRELGYVAAETVVMVRGHGGGHDPIGRSLLEARIQPRQNPNGTLNAMIEWSATSVRGTGVVTVVVPDSNDATERMEKVFACNKEGRQLANWIRPNDRYVFRLYEGRECPRAGRDGVLRGGDLGQMTERLVIANGQVREGRGGRGGRFDR